MIPHPRCWFSCLLHAIQRVGAAALARSLRHPPLVRFPSPGKHCQRLCWLRLCYREYLVTQQRRAGPPPRTSAQYPAWTTSAAASNWPSLNAVSFMYFSFLLQTLCNRTPNTVTVSKCFALVETIRAFGLRFAALWHMSSMSQRDPTALPCGLAPSEEYVGPAANLLQEKGPTPPRPPTRPAPFSCPVVAFRYEGTIACKSQSWPVAERAVGSCAEAPGLSRRARGA